MFQVLMVIESLSVLYRGLPDQSGGREPQQLRLSIEEVKMKSQSGWFTTGDGRQDGLEEALKPPPK